MSTYKVIFKYGKAVSAEIVDHALYNDIKKFQIDGERQFIEWFIVECDDDKEAITIADVVVDKL